VHGHHVAAADQGAADFTVDVVLRIGADDHHRGKAQGAHHQEEETDEAGGVEHRFARLLGVRHGEEAHQNVRQAGDAEHQAQGHRRGVDRIGEHRAGPMMFQPLAWACGFVGQGLVAETELRHRHHREGGATGQQQHGLDDLHPGGGDHAAEDHIHHHQRADDHHRHRVVEPEQQLDQLTRTDHLHDQVAAHHRQ
jgi:hypothetical protein